MCHVINYILTHVTFLLFWRKSVQLRNMLGDKSHLTMWCEEFHINNRCIEQKNGRGLQYPPNVPFTWKPVYVLSSKPHMWDTQPKTGKLWIRENNSQSTYLYPQQSQRSNSDGKDTSSIHPQNFLRPRAHCTPNDRQSLIISSPILINIFLTLVFTGVRAFILAYSSLWTCKKCRAITDYIFILYVTFKHV
jgi:hypothetical protein